MDARPISVGVIGCGEIAQLMHLPYLNELPHFNVAAICDISASVLSNLGRTYRDASIYNNYVDLLANDAVEAVVICNNDHGPIVRDVIAARKHFLVEKPVAFGLEETSGFVDALEREKLVGMVGYMKLFDPGYEFGLEKIADAGKPRSIRMHDFGGSFERYGQLYIQQKPTDIPEETLILGRTIVREKLRQAVGAGREGYSDLYFNLLMLGSHDLAVLRNAFGAPLGVSHARAVAGQHVLAILDYADSVPVVLEIAYGPKYEWWDEVLEVRGERDEVRIEFQNPYLKNNSADVYWRGSEKEWGVRGYKRGSPETSFRRQWQHFYEAVRCGVPVRSTLAGGISDVALAVDIIKALPPRE